MRSAFSNNNCEIVTAASSIATSNTYKTMRETWDSGLYTNVLVLQDLEILILESSFSKACVSLKF